MLPVLVSRHRRCPRRSNVPQLFRHIPIYHWYRRQLKKTHTDPGKGKQTAIYLTRYKKIDLSKANNVFLVSMWSLPSVLQCFFLLGNLSRQFLLYFSAFAALNLHSFISLSAPSWGFAAERDQMDLWVQSSKFACSCAMDADLQSFDYIWPSSPQITKYLPTFLTNFSSKRPQRECNVLHKERRSDKDPLQQFYLLGCILFPAEVNLQRFRAWLTNQAPWRF